MSRLPDPALKEIRVQKEYEGVEQDRDNFLKCLVELIRDVDLKGVS